MNIEIFIRLYSISYAEHGNKGFIVTRISALMCYIDS